MFVVDASVVVKWFVEEADSPSALSLKNSHIHREIVLLAPDLLLYEIANVLLFSNLFNTVGIKKCLQNLYDLEIDLINPSQELMYPIVEIASNKKITVYDASYLALAKEFNIKLITADRKLFSKTQDLHCVELLSA